jgi:hypothetical protein
METLLKVVYGTVFFAILWVGYLAKAIVYLFSLMGLGMQALYFRVSRGGFIYRQRSKFRQMDYEDTRKHWKELVDVLEVELNKYRQELNNQEFYLLRVIIAISFKKTNLRSLTKLHVIICETPKSEVVIELREFLKNNRHFY